MTDLAVNNHLAVLVTELQSTGLRVEVPTETRTGGAGPSDSGMLWIEGVPVTVPTSLGSPYVLKPAQTGIDSGEPSVRW